MKKKLLVLGLSLILVGCSNNKSEDTAKTEVSTSESAFKMIMTSNQISYYTEETIRHFFDIQEYNDDSWDQKDTINASIKRTEWVLKELDEKFEDDEAKASIQNLANDVNKVSKKLLNKEYENADQVFDDSYQIGLQIGDISKLYLDGNLPPSAM